MAHAINRLKTVFLAAALAAATVACSGSSGERGPIPPQAIRGDVTVTVSTTSATAFNGFDMMLTFDGGFMTAKLPLDANSGETGTAAGMLCETALNGSQLTLACADAAAVSGPGALGSFKLEYDDFVPVAADFGVACEFVDQDGNAIAGIPCTFDLAL